jgi:hypothetical protein
MKLEDPRAILMSKKWRVVSTNLRRLEQDRWLIFYWFPETFYNPMFFPQYDGLIRSQNQTFHKSNDRFTNSPDAIQAQMAARPQNKATTSSVASKTQKSQRNPTFLSRTIQRQQESNKRLHFQAERQIAPQFQWKVGKLRLVFAGSLFEFFVWNYKDFPFDIFLSNIKQCEWCHHHQNLWLCICDRDIRVTPQLVQVYGGRRIW